MTFVARGILSGSEVDNKEVVVEAEEEDEEKEDKKTVQPRKTGML